MLKTKTVTVVKNISVCTCDRCGLVMDEGDIDSEYQEKFSIATRGGWGSVFGDGNLIEGDFCQTCIQKTLGKWLRVTEDDPFRHKKTLGDVFDKIIQPWQRKKAFEKQIENQSKDK